MSRICGISPGERGRGLALEVVELGFHVRDVGGDDSPLRGPVAAPAGLRVGAGEDPLPVVVRDGRHGVSASRQKLLEAGLGREVAPGVQERMPKISKAAPAGGQQAAGDVVSALDLLLEVRERDPMEVRMRVRVVAQIQSGLEPALEEPDPGVLGRAAGRSELGLVDEPDRRRAAFADRGQKLFIHRTVGRQPLAGHGDGGQVVEGDGDSPDCGRGRREEHGREQRHTDHPGSVSCYRPTISTRPSVT